MKFGLFHSVQLPDPNKQAQYYKEALEQVLWAEQLGYDSVWITDFKSVPILKSLGKEEIGQTTSYSIYLGTAGWGVWHSPDAGESWVRHRRPFPLNSRIQALVVHPTEPNTVRLASVG